MLKQQEIEQKLAAINEAAFQNLCDRYIYFSEIGFPEIHSSGSQKGKQKTIKGKPDSFYQTNNGGYVLIEHTTLEKKINKNVFVKKILQDLSDCMDEKVTGISRENIEKIIYCCNSSLNLEEHGLFSTHCSKQGVLLKIIDLSVLAKGICNRCPHLAREFLGVSIDTGQVLTVETFIKEYESSGFASPLSTTLVSREKEIRSLEISVAKQKITIVNGPPGVGKTRLVIELLRKLMKGKPKKINCFCLSNKEAPIHDDLRTYLKDQGECVVFIDDANHQSRNLGSILPLLRENRTFPIRLIITVRDYALDEVKNHCIPYETEIITISKMGDEELTILLKSKKFNINNPDFIDRIIEIADGNPRLAIMAAQVAVRENNLAGLADVSNMYDNYFGNAVNAKVFSEEALIKTLGIISFFRHVNFRDEQFCKILSERFEIDIFLFRDSCNILEQFEILESDPDNSMVRISEQITATYFFYHSFFKQPVLDFGVILSNYLENDKGRISETVILANNTFGYDNVFKKTEPFMTRFWPTISAFPDKAFKFLEIFWFYRIDETLAFMNRIIGEMQEVTNPLFVFDEKEANSPSPNKDRYLSLLSKYFDHIFNSSEDVLDLSFLYVQKKPECYTQLIRCLRNSFLFRHEDQSIDFSRQEILCKVLTEIKSLKTNIATCIFFDVIPTLVKTQQNVTANGRKKDTISFYRYTIPFTEQISKFRRHCWEYILRQFTRVPEKVADFIWSFIERDPQKEIAIYQFDLEFILKIFKTCFSGKSFFHCYIVHATIQSCKRLNISNASLLTLKDQFNCEAYDIYAHLTYDLLEGEEPGDPYDENHRILKQQEIRNYFKFKSLVEFRKFYKIFKEVAHWYKKINPTNELPLDVLLEEALIKNSRKGWAFIKEIILSGNPSEYCPHLIYAVLCKEQNTDLFKEFYTLIRNNSFKQKQFWIFKLFYFLQEERLTRVYAKDLENVYKNAEGHIHAEYNYWDRFLNVQPEIYPILLGAIYNRNKEKKAVIAINHHLFDTKIQRLASNMPIARQTYLQQHKLNKNFDYNYKGFLEILKKDRNFLMEYLQFRADDIFDSRDHDGLFRIWQLDKPETILTGAFNYIASQNRYFGRIHFCNAFFKKGDNFSDAKGPIFLKKYLKVYKTNRRKVDMIFKCVRSSYPERMEEFLLYFLSINNDPKIFSQIDWIIGSYTITGDGSVGDIQKREYEQVLAILNKIKYQSYKFTEHKEFIRQNIQRSERYADRERKQKFNSQYH